MNTLVIYCVECDIPEAEHASTENPDGPGAGHPFWPCEQCKRADGPPHRPSAKCESGGYAHCSCGVCFD
jgi:hypothetical protein